MNVGQLLERCASSDGNQLDAAPQELLERSARTFELQRGSAMHTTAAPTRLDVEEAEARIAWVAQARCKGTDPDQLFVRGAAQRKAATICRHCPVLMQCGADALDNRVEFGVWGGMTERQRRALLKQHPEVDSWSDFFETQRQQQAAI
jgi:WhiB family redox-sensing transcriptional regulator